ncbi:hypothetical protein HZB94_03530 [Candidatus Falkowbacteria bacterium]|nr:hypothetical protein [Candidatus Falkowbacteria bacterium]
MRKALAVLMVLGMFLGCDVAGEDEKGLGAMQSYMKAKALDTRLVMQKCREGKIGEVPIATKKSVFVSLHRTLTDTQVDGALALMEGNAGPIIKTELKKTYNCLIENDVSLALIGTKTFALEAGKADDVSEGAPAGGIPAGSSGVSASVYIPDLGNVSASAVADSETVATVMGTVEEGAQGAIEELKQLSQCLAVIADCVAHVGLRNSWCIYNSHELNPGNAYCADGCCAHTSMVGMVHCLPSCGAGWVEADDFSNCENVTTPDDGMCPWNFGGWY